MHIPPIQALLRPSTALVFLCGSSNVSERAWLCTRLLRLLMYLLTSCRCLVALVWCLPNVIFQGRSTCLESGNVLWQQWSGGSYAVLGCPLCWTLKRKARFPRPNIFEKALSS